jgi:competence protein ComEC
MLSLLFLAAPAFSADHLLVDFLDVGQGDGVLIQTADGLNILIDGGKPSADVAGQLAALGITHLDLLVASHADYDHSGGHEDVLQDLTVDRYVTNGLAHTSQSYGRIMALVATQVAAGSLEQVDATSLLPGDDLGFGDLHLWVMPPPATVTGTDQNTHSIGIVLEYAGFKSLITGDSEQKETDAWLMDASYDSLIADVDVYKAIHHGAKNGDAGNTGWLDFVQPTNVVVQVGANGYGHPTTEALDTYDAYDALVWRNDDDGRVAVEVWATGGYTITTETSGIVDFVSADGVDPDGVSDCPATHPIKGNIGSSSMVYHWPGSVYYTRTQPEACFGTAADAAAAGFRASSR